MHLTALKKLPALKDFAARERSKFGVACNGDGGRVGAIGGKGRVMKGDHLLMICAENLLPMMA